MAYGQPPKEISDFWHLPSEDGVKLVKGRLYRLPKEVRSSLEYMEEFMKGNREITKEELSMFFSYLDNLSNKVRDILQLEKSDGLSNMELEKDFRKIGQLMSQVSSLLERY